MTAFSRLEGPCVIGPRTRINGANIRAGATIGPDCRVGGEVECSIIQGRSNKRTMVFWATPISANGSTSARTQTSDLVNDYGEASVVVNGRLIRTGQTKVGCFLGDHTKTAVGTLLNTGTSAGVFCNLLPAGLLPRRIPSFCRCLDGRLTSNGDMESLLNTAATMMARRGCELTPPQEALYRAIYDETAAQRRNARSKCGTARTASDA